MCNILSENDMKQFDLIIDKGGINNYISNGFNLQTTLASEDLSLFEYLCNTRRIEVVITIIHDNNISLTTDNYNLMADMYDEELSYGCNVEVYRMVELWPIILSRVINISQQQYTTELNAINIWRNELMNDSMEE